VCRLDYARHFMQACSRIIGVETQVRYMALARSLTLCSSLRLTRSTFTPSTQASTVFTADRAIPVGVFPVGIEPQKFLDNLDEPPVLYVHISP